MFIRICIIIAIIFFADGCKNSANNSVTSVPKSVPTIDYTLIKSYPHDTSAFTEGFLVYNGNLYESTGATDQFPQTKSLFGAVNLETGKIETKAEIDREKYFGEGIAFLNGKVYQLTYKNQMGFVYDAKTYKKIRQFTFRNKEGWGLTTDGKYLIMSDGTHELTYLDPNSLEVAKTIAVSENGFAKENLNELEYIKGYIYANIYTTDEIVKINPANGKIEGKLNIKQLADEARSQYNGSLETNGIAYDSISNAVYVTGKMWPKIFEISFNK